METSPEKLGKICDFISTSGKVKSKKSLRKINSRKISRDGKIGGSSERFAGREKCRFAQPDEV